MVSRKRTHPGRGRPKRAGDQPIVRVEIKFGESEIAEVDEARGDTDRGTYIRNAVLREARRTGRGS